MGWGSTDAVNLRSLAVPSPVSLRFAVVHLRKAAPAAEKIVTKMKDKLPFWAFHIGIPVVRGGCASSRLDHGSRVELFAHPIRATNQVVGIIGYGRGSVIGRKLAL